MMESLDYWNYRLEGSSAVALGDTVEVWSEDVIRVVYPGSPLPGVWPIGSYVEFTLVSGRLCLVRLIRLHPTVAARFLKSSCSKIIFRISLVIVKVMIGLTVLTRLRLSLDSMLGSCQLCISIIWRIISPCLVICERFLTRN